jgi:ubiquitin carboxyl-terminal hydrolase 34
MRAPAHGAETQKSSTSDQQDAVAKAMSLIVAAICDPNVIDQCSNEDLRLQLGLELVDHFVQLLKGLCPRITIPSYLLTEIQKQWSSLSLTSFLRRTSMNGS